MTNDSERERLREHYSRMSDGELLSIAGDMENLTDVAREAMSAELARRRLDATDVAAPRESSEKKPVERAHGEVPVAPVEIEFADEAVLVTVARFRDLPDALLAKATLESAEIGCVLLNDNMVRMDWFVSNATGGMRLQVHPEDVAEATRILAEPIPESFDVEGVGRYEQPHCPRCGSLDINYHETAPIAYGSMFLLKIPLPVVREGWRCHACGHEWQDSAEGAAGGE